MVKEIRHIGITTRNLAASQRFYELLGFKKILDLKENIPLYGGDIHSIKMKHEKAKVLLELIEPMNEVTPLDWHFALTVDKSEDALYFNTNRFEWKPGVTFIRAPEGTLIELVCEEEIDPQ